MSFISNIGRQLVQRRLWPVAILLVAALAAVPLALAKDPEVPPAQPVAQPPEDNDLAVEPIVTAATIDGLESGKVLGKQKNPFAVPKPASATTTTDEPSDSQLPADTSSKGGSDGGSPGGSTTTPPSSGGGVPVPGVPTVPTTPAKPAKSYDKYDLTVRFGSSDGEIEKQTLKRLQPLPEAELPALIYLGVSKDGKSAIFLLEQGVQVVGDGECDPTPDACETLRLEAGETEFLDVVDDVTGAVTAQYQLDLVKIHKGKTASASKASASSKAGRKLLAKRAGASGRLPFRFDVGSGTLERRPGVVGDVARSTASLG